jgi:hypothetical protein
MPAVLVSVARAILDTDARKSLRKTASMLTTLAMTTIYHPQVDGQIERTNQIVETACTAIPRRPAGMSYYRMCLSSSSRYGTHPRGGTTAHQTAAPNHESVEQLLRNRNDMRASVQARKTIYYDRRHSPFTTGGLVYDKLTHKANRGYCIPHTCSLDIVRNGLFRVPEKIA